MRTAGVAEHRERERAEELAAALRVCCSKMSMPLYLAFWFADLIYAPQLKWEFLFLRCLMIPVGLAVFYCVERAKTLAQIEATGLMFTAANAGLITVMIYRTEGPASPYYAGLNLVAVGILSFFPWSKRMLGPAILTIFGPYYLFGLLEASGRELVGLGLNTFFIAGTVIASLVKYYFTEQLRITEINSRVRLQHEIESREKVIDEQTREALRMSVLTKQFSPQVVSVIKAGRGDVLAREQKSDICAIFIDIVNSTDHVVRMDMSRINTVLAMFMEDTMKVLLKYDITIDKFLGDGVLAFSNAPIPHSDYIERVVNAALEIRGRIAKRNLAYMDHWLDEFQIRVGVATGVAHVGFYGCDEYFKSYTAIGSVVNLASRLCSAAQPNQILVCNSVAEKLAGTRHMLQCIGTPALKGFESAAVTVFELLDEERATGAGAFDVFTCPRNHGVLHLDTGDLGIYVFRCRECGYVLDTDKYTSIEPRPVDPHADTGTHTAYEPTRPAMPPGHAGRYTSFGSSRPVGPHDLDSPESDASLDGAVDGTRAPESPVGGWARQADIR